MCASVMSVSQLKLYTTVQVTGEHLKGVVQEVRGRVTPEEARALITRELRQRDQADSDKWQVRMLLSAGCTCVSCCLQALHCMLLTVLTTRILLPPLWTGEGMLPVCVCVCCIFQLRSRLTMIMSSAVLPLQITL